MVSETIPLYLRATMQAIEIFNLALEIPAHHLIKLSYNIHKLIRYGAVDLAHWALIQLGQTDPVFII